MSKWKPIESAPKDTEVLLYAGKYIGMYLGKLRKGRYYSEPSPDSVVWRDAGGRFGTPTHWIELPKPPKEEQ